MYLVSLEVSNQSGTVRKDGTLTPLLNNCFPDLSLDSESGQLSAGSNLRLRQKGTPWKDPSKIHETDPEYLLCSDTWHSKITKTQDPRPRGSQEESLHPHLSLVPSSAREAKSGGFKKLYESPCCRHCLQMDKLILPETGHKAQW